MKQIGGMNKQTQSIVVALLGGLLLSVTLSGRFTSYVRPGFKPLLLIGGGILLVVGIVTLVMALWADIEADRDRKHAPVLAGADRSGASHGGSATGSADSAAGSHGHDHANSKAPWLILVPVLVLLLVAPPALGADAVARNASSQALGGQVVVAQPANDPTSKDGAGGGGGGYQFNDGSGSATDSTGSRRTEHFPALQGTDPSITIKEFVLRALYDADNSVEGVPVTVTGFIAPPGQGYPDGYTIARMVISCCAADANPMQLHIAGDAPFPSDTWVDAVVTVVPNTATMDNGYVPTVTLTSATPVDQPDDPYEH
jgi:uncharacterized repeat protein (TIGR03943 family)